MALHAGIFPSAFIFHPSSLKPKSPTQSQCRTTELVLPNDTNILGNLMGGRLLHLMDICAAIAAQRHSNCTVVTASVDNVDFQSAIKLGEVVILESVVNRSFTTSMETEINVWAEDTTTAERRTCNRAFYTFVAVDQNGSPIPVPPIEPETDEQRDRFEAAAHRRELRLILSGRLKLDDTRHLHDHLAAVSSV